MEYLSLPAQAALWGFVAGGALLLGAAMGYFLNLSKMVSSSIMAFGIGVLISALAFNLMDEAFKTAGSIAATVGFVFGATLYGLANAFLSRSGAAGRKQSSAVTAGAAASIAIAIGSLLDGIPESAAIGISLLDGEGVAFVTLLAIFISNVPEGLSSSVGMKAAGKSASYVFSIWGSIAVTCSVSALLGYLIIGQLGPFYIGAAIACAAGAIFVMLIDTMIPEAFDDIHALSGPIAAAGFLFAFVASHAF
ncbi:ZIP family zinc transporter [Ahrensia kielensis]|uniref:ZIP family zinc transporter n=1 Tax=Ahrensia kielensis TaxID=76980 RepID=A0ABU9T289_9HYPH|nr:ZIP family zinc transporter [Ahrensia sp. 13_GOM-1096m]